MKFEDEVRITKAKIDAAIAALKAAKREADKDGGYASTFKAWVVTAHDALKVLLPEESA